MKIIIEIAGTQQSVNFLNYIRHGGGIILGDVQDVKDCLLGIKDEPGYVFITSATEVFKGEEKGRTSINDSETTGGIGHSKPGPY